MEIRICENPDTLGKSAAEYTAKCINDAIREKGIARIALSTGASQFDTIKHLVQQDVDWSKVEMFHLDEYVGMDESHGASFRKYLKERFVNQVKNLKAAHFVDGTAECIKTLTEEIRKSPIDIGLIGIGENSHIAFNDPPADFDTKEAYIIVNLDEKCRKQQLGEGWFPTLEDVPKQAISMTVYQIMQCKKIVSCVPYPVKADAIEMTLKAKETTPMVPATNLKEHPDFILYADMDSAKGIINF